MILSVLLPQLLSRCSESLLLFDGSSLCEHLHPRSDLLHRTLPAPSRRSESCGFTFGRPLPHVQSTASRPSNSCASTPPQQRTAVHQLLARHRTRPRSIAGPAAELSCRGHRRPSVTILRALCSLFPRPPPSGPPPAPRVLPLPPRAAPPDSALFTAASIVSTWASRSLSASPVSCHDVRRPFRSSQPVGPGRERSVVAPSTGDHHHGGPVWAWDAGLPAPGCLTPPQSPPYGPVANRIRPPAPPLLPTDGQHYSHHRSR